MQPCENLRQSATEGYDHYFVRPVYRSLTFACATILFVAAFVRGLWIVVGYWNVLPPTTHVRMIVFMTLLPCPWIMGLRQHGIARPGPQTREADTSRPSSDRKFAVTSLAMLGSAYALIVLSLEMTFSLLARM